MAIKNKTEKLRFSLVGAVNTVVDFGTLFTLTSLGLPTLPSNVISTTFAFCFSFFANKKYTFKSTGANIKRELLLFTVVTLFGLWLIQGIVITLMTALLSSVSLPQATVLFIAKITATICSLIWNYTLYSRIVFKKQEG